MPTNIKFTCECGVSILTFSKKPGESITCNNCGAQLIIPEESNKIHITGVIHTLKPDEIAEMKKKAREEKQAKNKQK